MILCNLFVFLPDRMFLCLFAGGGVQQIPKGLGTGVGESGRPNQIAYSDTR